MAKNLYIIIFIWFLYGCTTHTNKNIPIKEPPQAVQIDTSASYSPIPIGSKLLPLKDIYDSQVGVKEATGHNDGKEVEMYLRSTGLGKNNSWCSAFVHWCLDSAHVKNTITAWSPTAHNAKNLIWFGSQLKKEPHAGDVFTLYSVALHRIHHTGFFDQKINSTVYQTVEGNTSSEGLSVNGDGVYRRKRSFNTTYSISRWTKE